MNSLWTRVSSTLSFFYLALALFSFGCAQESQEPAPPPPDAPSSPPIADGGGSCADQPYVVNPDAAQDVVESPTNFLRCNSGDYALCYYSGADPLTCTVAESGESADCQCQVFTATEDQPMYVLMTSILNLCAFTEAVEQCGEDGSDCYNICNDDPHSPQCHGITLPDDQQQATVCDYIADGTFNAEADFISTFSFETVSAPNTDEAFNIACNDANGTYAGCMTASCDGEITDSQGHRYTDCDCPIWPTDGSSVDFQFGRRCDDNLTGNCAVSEGQIWSAAYNPAGCG